jgi:hypothetical protein
MAYCALPRAFLQEGWGGMIEGANNFINDAGEFVRILDRHCPDAFWRGYKKTALLLAKGRHSTGLL